MNSINKLALIAVSAISVSSSVFSVPEYDENTALQAAPIILNEVFESELLRKKVIKNLPQTTDLKNFSEVSQEFRDLLVDPLLDRRGPKSQIIEFGSPFIFGIVLKEWGPSYFRSFNGFEVEYEDSWPKY